MQIAHGPRLIAVAEFERVGLGENEIWESHEDGHDPDEPDDAQDGQGAHARFQGMDDGDISGSTIKKNIHFNIRV